MDTRLLRVWSNCKAELVSVLRILLKISVIYAFFSAGQVQAESSNSQPTSTAGSISNIRLTWNEDAQNFRGLQFFAVPVKELEERISSLEPAREAYRAFNFWLLPNRDLREALQKSLTREQREFRMGAPDIEWPYPEVGLGALLIREAFAASTPGDCPSEQMHFLEVSDALPWRKVSFERHNFERHLRIESKSNSADKCYFIKFDFVFEPRSGEGNFALLNNGNAHFSGPIYPLWQNRPTSTQLRFNANTSKLTLLCTGCRTTDSGEVVTDFVGLPPALTFTQKFRTLGDVFSVSTALLKKTANDSAWLDNDEISRTVKIFFDYAGGAIARAEKTRGRGWETAVRSNLLIDRLIAEQEGEIQLHPSFGKVSPLLGDYHRAALFRALARDFLRHSLSELSANGTWLQRREDEKVVSFLAEIWLNNAFPKLNRLKQISENLSFLPFFRAVQQGNAFLNNSVFVGTEEQPGELDFNIYYEFLAPMKGALIAERIRRCAAPEVFTALSRISNEIANGQNSILEFKNLIVTSSPLKSCLTPMHSGLLPESLPEEKIEIESDKNQLLIERRVLPNPPSHNFLFPQQDLKRREPLSVAIKDVRGSEENVVIPASETDSTIIPLPKYAADALILEPNRATSGDRLRWPRPLRTVLQALSLNYDSRRSDLVLRSQLQTTQTGDEWSRALLLGFRREFARNNLDLQFTTRTPSLIAKTSATLTISSNIRLERAPPSFLALSYGVERGAGGSLLYPDGAGLRLWLRRPLSLSALQEKMVDPNQEWIFSYAAGLAPRLTWSEIVSYGFSESGVDVGLRSVPAWPSGQFVSTDYALLRSELRQTLTQNLNASLAKTILFQHAVLYGAHVLAFDQLQTEREVRVDARVAQSLVIGIRMFGALFGAKDQAVSLEVARALTSPARTSFGLSLGKAVN